MVREVRVLSGALKKPGFAGLFVSCGMMRRVKTSASDLSSAARRRQDAEINQAARDEMLRLDGATSLGENLEQADALIRAAFELVHGFAAANP